ncbi:MAG TPA: glycerol-3-phosphate acyltransferase [Acidimicrobiia bacterium]|nr:glycerol-3-phosphate acyltransferase [Actinomycetota bacterium]HIL45535.1 glycerol-3-phosphate acyltransferase [Acidimicrobiia bacterium]MBT4476391.1 glycerol-3-phosphate acyltransferase [Actinomycetota bacterium]MBT4655650.1 glycerol-3-phosphate acyltransferase [Actinomycetota bacterium]MBT5704014.1 glycerol-3-phosphate acyltransferase [Actinomycetota bacterium]
MGAAEGMLTYMLVNVVLIAAAYLLGTFPSAHLVAGRVGMDPTKEGSGNPGATNVYRIAGRRPGVVVFFLDFLKGLVAATAGLALDGRPLGVACWVAATVGHVVPVTRGLKGGKGVATSAGGAVVLFPLPAAGGFALFFLLAQVTKKVSLGSISVALAMPLLLVLTGRPANEVWGTAALGLLIVARHHRNIRRLLNGTESSWSPR